jgi:hypothetical protein
VASAASRAASTFPSISAVKLAADSRVLRSTASSSRSAFLAASYITRTSHYESVAISGTGCILTAAW